MEQDFSKKIVVVIREGLPNWQVLNTVAHASAYLGNKLGTEFATGEDFITRDGQKHPRNSQYAIVALSAKEQQLKNLVKEVRASGLPYLGFLNEMIETTDDSEIERLLSQKDDEEVEYLGVGIFGPKDVVSQMTKKFSLWK